MGFALALTMPLLAACQQLIGVSDYTKDDCSGGGSQCLNLDGSFTDGPTRTDGGKDAGDSGPIFIDAAGSDPVSWAKFTMPNYAQNDAGIPSTSIPTYGLKPNSDAGAIVDSVSLLVWRPVSDDEKKGYSFDQATKLCESAKASESWRLPTRIELVTLLDLSRNPASDAKFNMEGQRYWTTSLERLPSGNPAVPQGIPTGNRLVLSFDRGTTNIISAQAEKDTARAICIQAK